MNDSKSKVIIDNLTAEDMLFFMSEIIDNRARVQVYLRHVLQYTIALEKQIAAQGLLITTLEKGLDASEQRYSELADKAKELVALNRKYLDTKTDI